jgi:hypothetical protein
LWPWPNGVQVLAGSGALMKAQQTIAAVGCRWQRDLPGALLRTVLAYLVAPTSYSVGMVCRTWSLWSAAAGSAGLETLDKLTMWRWYRMPSRLSTRLRAASSMRIADLMMLREIAPQLSALSMHGQVGELGEARSLLLSFSALTTFSFTYQAPPDPPPLEAPTRVVRFLLPPRVRAVGLWAAGWRAVVQFRLFGELSALEELRIRGSASVSLAAATLPSLRRLLLASDSCWCPRKFGPLLKAAPKLEVLDGAVIEAEADMKAIAACSELTGISLCFATQALANAVAWSELARLSQLTKLSLPAWFARTEALSYDARGGGLSGIARISSLRMLCLSTEVPGMPSAARELLALHTTYIASRLPLLRIIVVPNKPRPPLASPDADAAPAPPTL